MDHYWFDCIEARLYRCDTTEVGARGRARQRPASWGDQRRSARVKAMGREIRNLRQANEILRKASAYFAMAELDRRSKP